MYKLIKKKRGIIKLFGKKKIGEYDNIKGVLKCVIRLINSNYVIIDESGNKIKIDDLIKVNDGSSINMNSIKFEKAYDELKITIILEEDNDKIKTRLTYNDKSAFLRKCVEDDSLQTHIETYMFLKRYIEESSTLMQAYDTLDIIFNYGVNKSLVEN